MDRKEYWNNNYPEYWKKRVEEANQNKKISTLVQGDIVADSDKGYLDAINFLSPKKNDTIFPVVPFSYPIQRALKINGDKVSFINPKYGLKMSQDLDKSYHDVGQFYFINCASFLNNKVFISNNTGMVILDELIVQDIDTEADWTMAELKYKLLNSSEL